MVFDVDVAALLAPFLVFVRVGSALIIMPGFGEPYVLARMRLLLALLISLALTAPLVPLLPALPGEPAALARLLVTEAVIGLFIGGAARTIFAALHITGTAIAFQSGLAAAAAFDPNEATQGTLPGTLLTTIALVLLFATDGHHLLLRALAHSYQALPPGGPLPLGEFAEVHARLIADAFAIAVRLASPLLAVGLLIYLGMGVLNRLMPAFQVFFIALPVQIVLAFAVLMLSLGGGMLVFFESFEAGLRRLPVAG